MQIATIAITLRRTKKTDMYVIASTIITHGMKRLMNIPY